ncbi:hypothetical protein BJ684DRAFT_7455 [Piptocephalis cylindrospora]|uniref:E3 ubiquitin-protein ligase CHIP n=1 Tax=Piptocephalis cylindrospora TaxID=1907219 RepID=A0A4P9YAQ0_9FUNG|nr:hypothetical protein BJ684DRAFT_7455 [Piptocephalis cylindrospora]|eukprot:RKP15170.1 hypothetical protein BJ684DRAFT_7455 [Piptocephalis cylindrospora]
MNAESHKIQGNARFAQGDYQGAIQSYTTAIIKDPTCVLYYTNRARAHMKLEQWSSALQDAEKAVEFDPNHVKGNFLLGQALTSNPNTQDRLDEAIKKLDKAYALAIGYAKTRGMAEQVGEALRVARRLHWERQEGERMTREHQLLIRLKTILDKHEVEDKVMGDAEIEELWEEVKATFSRAEDASQKREIPEAYLCKITFSIMHDPVITPSGITYERTALLSHFKHLGHFDPLSRAPLRDHQLLTNLALKEAIEDFLSK